MRARRKRHGNCLLQILATLAVVAGLVMTGVGAAIYVYNSERVAAEQRVYDEAVGKARSLGGIRGPRDRSRDLAIEANVKVADIALANLHEAKSGQRIGSGLLAGGLITTVVGAGLFVLFVVLQIRRGARSTPPSERDVPRQSAPSPERSPAPSSTPSPPPRRDAAAESDGDVPPQPDPWSEPRPAPIPFWGPVLVLVAAVAIVFVFVAGGIYAVVRLASSASPPITQPKEPAAENAAPVEPGDGGVHPPDPSGPPPAPAPPGEGEQYLRDLAATDVKVLDKAIDRKFTVRKVPFEHGVYLHPPESKSSGEATYRLERAYKRLRGAVGIRDDRFFRRSMSPLTFRLVADEKELWHSRPLQTASEWEPFDVDLTGVERLTLRVDCPRFHTGAHAAWLDPILVRAASGKTPAPAGSAKPVAKDGASALPDDPPPTSDLVIDEEELRNLERIGPWRRTVTSKVGTYHATWTIIEGKKQIRLTRDDKGPGTVLKITGLENGRITLERKDVAGIAAGMTVTYVGDVKADGSMKGECQHQLRGDSWEGTWTAEPMPPAPAPLKDGEQYLRELAATDVKIIDDKKTHPIDRTFAVRKVPFEHGVYLHPPTSNSSAEASYQLEGGYKRLRGAVGIVDENTFGGSMTPLTFRLLADGKELWRSRTPLKKAGEWESFDVDLTGVKQLTLKVDCPGFHTGAGAAWLDPILVRAASTAAPAPSEQP